MYNSSTINAYEGTKIPSSMHVNSEAYNMWYRSLYQRALSIFKFNLPDEWMNQSGVKDYFENILLTRGFMAIWNDKEFGLMFNPCTLGGYNVFYQPVTALVSNPKLVPTRELTIGKDCGILKLSPDFTGINDIIRHYAIKLALLDSALDQSFVNQKLTTVVSVPNKASAETIKKAFDGKTSGEPIIVLDNSVGAERSEILDSSGYISDKQLTDVQTILNMYDAEIGIPTSSKEKSQYISDMQIDTKQIDGSARVNTWLETIQQSIEECKKVIPNLNISVEYVYEQNGGDIDGKDNNVRSGTENEKQE